MDREHNRAKPLIVFSIAILLAVLHQDFWFWGDRRLMFDFLPVGLAYHALFSMLAACLWWLAVKIAWPSDVEKMAEMSPGEGEGANTR